MIGKHKIFFIVITLYLLSASALLIASLYINQWHLVYVLDDPYIHMTIAKNFVEHGNWATNQLTFTSASSSPLWTLIISGVYFVFGINVITPFILNILFGIFAIYIAYYIFRKYNITKYLFVFLIVFIYVTPLLTMLFVGMEHTAQIAVSLLFVYYSSKLIASENKKNNEIKYLLIIVPILTALRYEGMFLVIVVSFLLLLRKKILYAFLIAALGILPIIIYGIISTSHGWFFLPNTILIKSMLPDYSIPRLFFRAYKNITEPHIFLMLILGVLVYVFNIKKQIEFRSEKQIFLIIFIFTTIINISLINFADNGWFFRYEAYLMALGVTAIAIGGYDLIPEAFVFKSGKGNFIYKTVISILLFIIILPFVLRAFTPLLVPPASKNIYEQQYQMGLFVKNYLNDVNIAANDIGMVNFYSNNNVVDLWGLANIEVGTYKIRKEYDTQKIFDIVKQNNVKVAILYEHWFDQYGGLPPQWVKIGEWTMTDYNLVCGAETVAFYSINPEDANNFRKKLKDFSTQLPKSVSYKMY
jgi:hypothetical protein